MCETPAGANKFSSQKKKLEAEVWLPQWSVCFPSVKPWAQSPAPHGIDLVAQVSKLGTWEVGTGGSGCTVILSSTARSGRLRIQETLYHKHTHKAELRRGERNRLFGSFQRRELNPGPCVC